MKMHLYMSQACALTGGKCSWDWNSPGCLGLTCGLPGRALLVTRICVDKLHGNVSVLQVQM